MFVKCQSKGIYLWYIQHLLHTYTALRDIYLYELNCSKDSVSKGIVYYKGAFTPLYVSAKIRLALLMIILHNVYPHHSVWLYFANCNWKGWCRPKCFALTVVWQVPVPVQGYLFLIFSTFFSGKGDQSLPWVRIIRSNHDM